MRADEGRRRRGTCPSILFARIRSAPVQAGLPAQGFVPPAFPTRPLRARQWQFGGTPAQPASGQATHYGGASAGEFRERPDKKPLSGTPLPFYTTQTGVPSKACTCGFNAKTVPQPPHHRNQPDIWRWISTTGPDRPIPMGLRSLKRPCVAELEPHRWVAKIMGSNVKMRV